MTPFPFRRRMTHARSLCRLGCFRQADPDENFGGQFTVSSAPGIEATRNRQRATYRPSSRGLWGPPREEGRNTVGAEPIAFPPPTTHLKFTRPPREEGRNTVGAEPIAFPPPTTHLNSLGLLQDMDDRRLQIGGVAVPDEPINNVVGRLELLGGWRGFVRHALSVEERPRGAGTDGEVHVLRDIAGRPGDPDGVQLAHAHGIARPVERRPMTPSIGPAS